MNRFFRQFGLFCFGVLLASVVVNAGAIKTWTNEILTYTDLNSNFEHLHNNMVGGHGARLVNADVSTSAAIAHSKLATPALVPKAFVYVAQCTASPCSILASSGVSSVTRTGTGAYVVTWSSARPNAVYSLQVSGYSPAAGAAPVRCDFGARATTNVIVGCYNAAEAAVDAGFDVLMMDNDN